MVCVANEVTLKCVFERNQAKVLKSYFVLPASTTIDELYKHVSSLYDYEVDSFELELCSAEADKRIELARSVDMTLLELEPNCLNQTTTILLKPLKPPPLNKSYMTQLIDKCSVLPLAGEQEPEDEFSAASNVAKMKFDFRPSLSAACERIERTDDFIPNHSEKNYVGLVNQAMTCYLNSLLQALYMTPEFRNALYNWEYVDGSEKDEACSIPYQLQKLFLNLQTSSRQAVETTSLTKSFGWDSTQAWQQQDIQELCRVMFDALEKKFKDTEQADLINRLYEGKMIDYVKCLECKIEKTREDTFLDIPLPVRPFESHAAYSSVEEALTAFVKHETLDGNNQYYCEKCNKKCDAHKGLKFTKFPYLLTLHLKRFDFDYKTYYRIKLNDKVTFPHTLDLNSFVETTTSQKSSSREEDDITVKCDANSTTNSGTSKNECPPCDSEITTNHYSNNHDQDVDDGIDMSNGHSTSNGIAHNHEKEENPEKRLTEQGPYVYDLFSIMIHSGSASGGHYYAYIKDFQTQQWLCFNDTSVNPITHNDIEKVYGGGPTRAYSSSTNAYMLMYRQIDPNKNALPIQEEDFPLHIQTLLKRMKETEDDDRRYRGKNMSIYTVKVYYHHPKTKKRMMNKLHMLEGSTWSEQTECAYEKFGLSGDDVGLDQCRLVFYDPSIDLITHTYEDSGKDLFHDVFKGDKVSDLLLEIREESQPFEKHEPDGVATKVYVIDVPRADILDGPISVRGYLSQTVREFKQKLSHIVNIDPTEMKLVAMILSQYRLLQDDETLQAEGFAVYNVHKLYVCSNFNTEITNPPKNTSNKFPNSILFSVIESFEKLIWCYVHLPEVGKDDLVKDVLQDSNIPYLETEIKEESLKPKSNGMTEVPVNNSSDNFEGSDKSAITRNSQKIAKWAAGLESTSEDSSLSDSEKTLVDDNSTNHNTTKFELVNKCNYTFVNSDSDEKSEYYFKCIPCPEGNEKVLKVFVDIRMNFETFKKKLENFVKVSVDNFNIYCQAANDSEQECIDLKAKLILYNDGERFRVKLERALRKGELKFKLYQLLYDCPEKPFKFMFDWIVSTNMTVAQAKKEILPVLKHKYNMDIPLEKLRLRMKCNKSPSTVLLDNCKFDDFIISSQDELIMQELPEKETVIEGSQLVLFVRKWCRSTLELDPIQEVVLNGRSVSELKEKINLLSGIPEEYIDVVKGKGSFPCGNMNRLNLETELDWKVKVKEVNKWPLDLENGSVVLYRDSRENLKQLNPEEKVELMSKEMARLCHRGIRSQRREKALKIYLDSK